MHKIKRHEVAAKLKNGHRLTEIDRELTRRTATFAKEVAEKKLSNYEANRRYLIILEYRELLQLIERKGLQLPELMNMINNLPDSHERGRQAKMILR